MTTAHDDGTMPGIPLIASAADRSGVLEEIAGRVRAMRDTGGAVLPQALLLGVMERVGSNWVSDTLRPVTGQHNEPFRQQVSPAYPLSALNPGMSPCDVSLRSGPYGQHWLVTFAVGKHAPCQTGHQGNQPVLRPARAAGPLPGFSGRGAHPQPARRGVVLRPRWPVQPRRPGRRTGTGQRCAVPEHRVTGGRGPGEPAERPRPRRESSQPWSSDLPVRAATRPLGGDSRRPGSRLAASGSVGTQHQGAAGGVRRPRDRHLRQGACAQHRDGTRPRPRRPTSSPRRPRRSQAGLSTSVPEPRRPGPALRDLDEALAGALAALQADRRLRPHVRAGAGEPGRD